MVRTSCHILKFTNQNKLDLLEKTYTDYEHDLKIYIGLILSGQLPLKKFVSTKYLPIYNLSYSEWRSILYKQASEIIRSNLKHIKNKVYAKFKKLYAKCIQSNKHIQFTKKRFSELNINYLKRVKINVKSISISLDYHLFNIKSSKHFDKFIQIRLPYFQQNKHRAETINLPVKHHKQSLKFKDWTRKNTVQILKRKGNFYIQFFYEKEIELKQTGKEKAIDIGYKKLIVSSDGEFLGREMEKLYEKISRKKQGSKNFEQALTQRDNEINRICNQLDLDDVKTLFVEDLKNVKHRTKQKKSIKTSFMNKLQRWSYKKVLKKIEHLCEEIGIRLMKVSPAYTSQRCSNCGTMQESSRKGEQYHCIVCGMELDADYNASLNILHRGVYNPSIV